jgi:hypothetical protein
MSSSRTLHGEFARYQLDLIKLAYDFDLSLAN